MEISYWDVKHFYFLHLIKNFVDILTDATWDTWKYKVS